MDLPLLIGDLGHPEKQKCQNVAIATSFLAGFCWQMAQGWSGIQAGRVQAKELAEGGSLPGKKSQRAVQPPSTTRRLPVVKLAARLAR